jgi:hypothetical protein
VATIGGCRRFIAAVPLMTALAALIIPWVPHGRHQ